MSAIYLYTDEASWQILSDSRQKVVLIGSDFGYGNFGDVLQHLNTVQFIKRMGGYATVSVMAANAIGASGFPEWARDAYAVDAIIYVADYPLILDEKSPKLKAVEEVRNLAAIHLYGGGFLNKMWGDYVLSVAEYFLRLAPGVGYFVSGQQITDPYQHVLINHFKKFPPNIFGVRDEISRDWLHGIGLGSHFSFDDATEALIDLTQRSGLRKGGGLLLHLNSSDYTANDSANDGPIAELSALKTTAAAATGVTVFQAYRDPRQEVVDSTETIKRLDVQFPFYDLRVVDLVGLIFGQGTRRGDREISGEFGYSCSYHVALWLQLAGIPCWLKSSNSFYSQKSKALQVTQDLASFLREPRLADHASNLERRGAWRSLLENEFLKLDEVNNVCRIPDQAGGPAPWPFFFKGKPTLQERLGDSMADAAWQRQRAETAEKALERATVDLPAESSNSEVPVCTAMDEHKDEQNISAARAEIAELAGRIEALTMQLTEVGHMVHQQRARADAAERAISNIGHAAHQRWERDEIANRDASDARVAVRHLSEQLAAIHQSRSWRITRIPRGLARFIRWGHFDSRGDVGLFEAVRRASRYLPVTQKIKSKIGGVLRKFRRK